MIALRDYQSDAIQALYDYFAERRGDAPIVIVPTGGGKSLILAAFMKRALDEYPSTRILAATHVKELVSQNFQELMRLWPNAPAGIYSAGLNKRQARAQLLFASVQSIYKRAREIGHVDLLMVDEAHLVSRNAQSQYGKLIDALRTINPAMKIVGLTATAWRLDSGCLHRGDDRVFDGIAYEVDLAMMVRRGFLCPLISKRPGTVFDTTGLHKRMGDFIEKEMVERFATDEVTKAATAEIVALAGARKAWLAFCINVDHALVVRDMLRALGVHAETVTGETPAPTRDRLLRDFKSGRITCLTSVNVIATGFNAPHVDLIALMRPTASAGLYIQMAGRGLRTYPGKTDCLVLDFANVVQTHGPIDAIALPGEKKASDGDGEAPSKVCPSCKSVLLIAARECPDCGHVFPEPKTRVEKTATTEAIMNLTAVERWQPVRDVDYARHKKDGSPDSLRVNYLVGSAVVSEWVCFEHGGYARQKAVAWWQTWAGTPPPDKTGEALARVGELDRPGEAVIERDGKYHRIKKLRKAKVMA